MCQKVPAQNTLFVGNGFSRAVFQGVPEWGNLFGNVAKPLQDIKNYTFLYEAFRLKLGQDGSNESRVKEKFIEKIRALSNDLSSRVDHSLEEFGDLLRTHMIDDIITTNYDYGVEHILQDICGYQEEIPEGLVPEQIYNIRTYKLFMNKATGHKVKLWKIHGDLVRIESITLGFDQYCGTLSKLENYIKGSYRSTHGENPAKCDIHMLEKCEDPALFDGISWVELFFNTNVYIVGSGMDFSEIDLWWLLNKRARFMLETTKIQNSIVYLYNEAYENRTNKPELFTVLDAFKIACKPIGTDPNYLKNVFDLIT